MNNLEYLANPIDSHQLGMVLYTYTHQLGGCGKATMNTTNTSQGLLRNAVAEMTATQSKYLLDSYVMGFITWDQLIAAHK